MFLIKLGNLEYFSILGSGIDSFEGEKSYYSTSSIQGIEIGVPEEIITYENRPSRANMQPITGSVGFAKMAKTLKVIKIDEKFAEKSILSTGFALMYGNPDSIDSVYLKYFFLSSDFNSQKDRLSTGTTQVAINQKGIEKIEIPLPSLETQQLIVSEIEKQFSRLDEGLSSLIRIRQNLKSYRASLLKSAIEGRLTQEWRAENPDIENADLLLDRIRTARREKWLSENPGKKYKEATGLKSEATKCLSDKWTCFRLNDIIRVGTGATPYKGNSNYWHGGNIPWITSSCVNEKIVLEANNFITELALKETNVKLFPEGSLIIALYGEGKTRGKITELGIEASTNQACSALIFDETNSFLKSYIKIFFEKNYFDLRRMSAGGVQPNLNVGIIQNLTIPLPPLLEQHRIVEVLEEKFSIIDSLESLVNANIRRAENLKQAILKKAFSGELVQESEQ